MTSESEEQVILPSANLETSSIASPRSSHLVLACAAVVVIVLAVLLAVSMITTSSVQSGTALEQNTWNGSAFTFTLIPTIGPRQTIVATVSPFVNGSRVPLTITSVAPVSVTNHAVIVQIGEYRTRVRLPAPVGIGSLLHVMGSFHPFKPMTCQPMDDMSKRLVNYPDCKYFLEVSLRISKPGPFLISGFDVYYRQDGSKYVEFLRTEYRGRRA